MKFQNETEFRKWFETNYSSLGYLKILKSNRTGVPDFVMKKKDGTTERVELELYSIDFINHKHNSEDVDKIVCLFSKERYIKGVPVVSINKEYISLGKLKNTTTLNIEKKTLKQLGYLRITKRESYDEIVNRLIKYFKEKK